MAKRQVRDILVERHVVDKSHVWFAECDRVAWLSKNLFNAGLYINRQRFFKHEGILDSSEIRWEVKDTIDYTSLPAKVCNNILQSQEKCWTSYFAVIKSYNKDKSSFTGKPKIPKYKNTKTGRNVVPYEKGALIELRKHIRLSGTDICIPYGKKVTRENIQSARIVVRHNFYIIEIMYEMPVPSLCEGQGNIMGIDLGLNNLLSIGCSNGYKALVDGKSIKSINQFYNKQVSKIQNSLSVCDLKSSKQKVNVTNKRNRRIEYLLHKATKTVIELCKAQNVTDIVLGYNEGWKQDINIGKKNNQQFVSIPFYKIKNQLIYKTAYAGIRLHIVEESYTSKCSFVDNEPLAKQTKYMGRRKHRGLFVSANNTAFNADINGAFNIIRKQFPSFTYSDDLNISQYPKLFRLN